MWDIGELTELKKKLSNQVSESTGTAAALGESRKLSPWIISLRTEPPLSLFFPGVTLSKFTFPRERDL